MITRNRWLDVLLAAVLLAAASETIATAIEELPIPTPLADAPGEGIVVQRNFMVPMRDGVRLATDIYRPAGNEKYPVVLIRTPYGTEVEPDGAFLSRGKFYVKRGYALAVQDVRGKYDSEGDWYGKRNEAEDGSDTITWLGTQAWSSGKVGMTGGSYLGMVQYLVSDQENPYLKALVPMVAPVTLGRDIKEYDHLTAGWARESGSYSAIWMLMTDGRVNQSDGFALREHGVRSIGAKDPLALSYSYWGNRQHLPAIDYPRVLGREMKWAPFVNNQRYGFWEEYYLRASLGEWSKPIADAAWWASYPERYRKVNVPIRHVAGWLDCCFEPQIKMFQLVRSHAVNPVARDNQQLIVGPWVHDVGNMKEVGVDFGAQAPMNPDAVSVEWFDRWLKDNRPAGKEPAVRIFLMGENRWKEADDWPIPKTAFTKFYLRANDRSNASGTGGSLSLKRAGIESPDRYTYDPADPTPSMVGKNLRFGSSVPGVGERTAIQSRKDVLTYTSEPLSKPLEVAGPLSATIYLSTSAPSTDLYVKLIDVHPSGESFNAFYAYANPYRTHWAKSIEPAKDGERVIKAEITLPSTGIVFRTGHRLRIEISSASAPKFRGLNVSPGTEAYASQWNVAEQTIYHDRARPSHIVLPVIPRQ